jgi:hypothetical protein
VQENKKLFFSNAGNLEFCIFYREHSTRVKNLGCGPGEDDKRDKNVHDAGNMKTLMTTVK